MFASKNNSVNAYSAVSENEINAAVEIFPNPSNGSFRLLTKEVFKKAEVTIIDPAGKKVYQNIFYNTSSAYIQLHAAKGIYFLTLKTDMGTVKQKLLIQ